MDLFKWIEKTGNRLVSNIKAKKLFEVVATLTTILTGSDRRVLRDNTAAYC